VNAEQHKICMALGTVAIGNSEPGSFDNTFCTSMYHRARMLPFNRITDKQNEMMYRMLYKYRETLPELYKQYQKQIEKIIFKK
jgi:hypothetical protein